MATSLSMQSISKVELVLTARDHGVDGDRYRLSRQLLPQTQFDGPPRPPCRREIIGLLGCEQHGFLDAAHAVGRDRQHAPTPSKSLRNATPRSQPFETSTLSHGMGASDLVRWRRHLKLTIFHSKLRSAGAGWAADMPRAAIASIKTHKHASRFQIFTASLPEATVRRSSSDPRTNVAPTPYRGVEIAKLRSLIISLTAVVGQTHTSNRWSAGAITLAGPLSEKARSMSERGDPIEAAGRQRQIERGGGVLRLLDRSELPSDDEAREFVERGGRDSTSLNPLFSSSVKRTASSRGLGCLGCVSLGARAIRLSKNCAPMAEELRLAGSSVIEADRADEALDIIEFGQRVDLVLSDIQTPGSLDGLQLAQTLWGKFPTFR